VAGSRFKKGDRVRVLSPEASVFTGVEGIVEEIKQHPRNLTQLDLHVAF